MDLNQLPITAEMREAFRVSGGAPFQVEDPLTKKLYWMAKQPTHPSLNDESILTALEILLDRYAKGDLVEWSDERVIAEAGRWVT